MIPDEQDGAGSQLARELIELGRGERASASARALALGALAAPSGKVAAHTAAWRTTIKWLALSSLAVLAGGLAWHATAPRIAGSGRYEAPRSLPPFTTASSVQVPPFEPRSLIPAVSVGSAAATGASAVRGAARRAPGRAPRPAPRAGHSRAVSRPAAAARARLIACGARGAREGHAPAGPVGARRVCGRLSAASSRGRHRASAGAEERGRRERLAQARNGATESTW
jgi:hypothetical protein